jgi:5-formyltetrahydrofolate cyclo-ligase
MTAEKQELRVEVRAARAALPVEQRAAESAAIASLVLAHPEVQAASTVHCYLSMPTEVDTMPIIRTLMDSGKQIVVPWMNEDRTMGASFLDPVDIAGISETGRLRVPQAPMFRPVEDGLWDVVLVPLVAATVAGDRMGNGAGHYDRLLTTWPRPALGLALQCQLVAVLPLEPHDVRLTAILHAARS